MDMSDAAPSIAEEELAGGAVRLSRAGGKAKPAAQRDAARIITMAWGDRYIADLLSLTIPALLAPGNVPAFVPHFDAEFVIVTEARLFGRISRSPAIFHLLRYCDVRLVPVDDLLSNWYGITLTYALVRGFVDLGEAMVGAHLVFLNADFIVADGSYAKLAEAILRGERLVVSPSYCMVLEDTIGQLRARYDAAAHALAIPPRELAAMILAHRHNTVRAKTVNQQLFRIHRYDQFYWYVDDQTLLCRQMPIAVIYMRPERVLTEMPTFWDYGVIAEFCPTTVPCVLGDSDDFLMAELRTEGTFAELLHLGWPGIGEIADDLSSFTTQDHRDYGRHTLILHSADLPAEIVQGKAGLATFVDQVYDRLSSPISHLNHPFWVPAFPRFLARHAAELERRQRRDELRGQLLSGDPTAAARHGEMGRLRSRIREAGMEQLAAAGEEARHRRRIGEKLAELDADYRARRGAVEHALVTRLAPAERRAAEAATALQGLDSELDLLISEEERRVDAAAGLEAAPERVPQTSSAGIMRWYYRIFGQLPNSTSWHPYHAMLRPARDAILSAQPVSDILFVSSTGYLGPLLVRDIAAEKVSITPRMAIGGLYNGMIAERRRFDLCVLDLSFDDLFDLRILLDHIRPVLAARCRVVVFHHNRTGRLLDEWTSRLARTAFPLIGRSRVAFAGSRPGALAAWLFTQSIDRPGSRWSRLLLMATLGLSAPLARLASAIEARRSPQRLPRHCTSLTIDIEFG
jgi:hypothetical protein